MLDQVLGIRSNPIAAKLLVTTLEKLTLTGTLYLGYPILASADEVISIDALLTSEEHGLVIFDLEGAATREGIEERQDDLFSAINQKLIGVKALWAARGTLKITIHVVTFLPSHAEPGQNDPVHVCTPETLKDVLGEFDAVEPDVLQHVNASIQRVSTLRPPRKRGAVKKKDSLGAIIREIEREIANLDKWQKRAAVELPEGPQRIRGLAGSGKTVVLALKAAYLHAKNPEWRIGLTFHTRTLYQQFKDLVRRFSFEHLKDEPDWERLQILHAWGSRRQTGVYHEIASQYGLSSHDFLYGRRKYGYGAAFKGVCQELLDELADRDTKPFFDAVLVDEAQDLPHPFFELLFRATKEPKRIVWAYDELQNLGEYSMSPPAELFGADRLGNPNVPDLQNEPGEPSQDLILPVCYRNTPWALTIAHVLGFGIYREKGLVQFFEESSLWEDIGYKVMVGSMSPGKKTELKRKQQSYPGYFDRLINSDDSVRYKVFKSLSDQYQWVAKSIAKNITEDELEYRDVLVIMANPRTARNEGAKLIRALGKLEIPAHLAGVMSSPDELFDDQSIAVCSIYRAKGNEAPMVYVLNSDYCHEGVELIKKRNILFTAITRSRSWVRLCGVGPPMEALTGEIEKVKGNDYKLVFTVPTPEELDNLRRIHRDMTPQELAKARRAEKNLDELVSFIEQGMLTPDQLPEELVSRIRKLFASND